MSMPLLWVMREGVQIYSILLLLFLLLTFVMISQEVELTGQFWLWFNHEPALNIDDNKISASCGRGDVGAVFANQVLAPYYGCDVDELCESALVTGVLPNDIQVYIPCGDHSRRIFIQRCLSELQRICS
jgi:hypothetical protein